MKGGHDDLQAIRQVVNQVLERYDHDGTLNSPSRAEILVHSMQVFAEHGLERATVQHLLEASGVSRRTFYKYFRNKMEVLESIYRIFVDNMLMHFHREMREAHSVNQIIANTTKVYFDYHTKMGPIIKLMMEEARSSGSMLAPHRVRAQQIAASVLTTEIGRLTGRYLDPLVMRTMLWSLEEYSLYIFEDGTFSAARMTQCQRVMVGIAESVILGEDASGKLLSPAP